MEKQIIKRLINDPLDISCDDNKGIIKIDVLLSYIERAVKYNAEAVEVKALLSSWSDDEVREIRLQPYKEEVESDKLYEIRVKRALKELEEKKAKEKAEYERLKQIFEPK